MQVMHIEKNWVTHWVFRLTGMPPAAKCGATIWQWTEDTEPWEHCPDCLDVHEAQGYPVPDDADGADVPLLWPGDVDPDELIHITTVERGGTPLGLCGAPIVAMSDQVGRCAECCEINQGWPEPARL